MTPVAITRDNSQTTFDAKDAMDILLGKLDEAIEDIENGRILSSEEMWKEIDQM